MADKKKPKYRVTRRLDAREGPDAELVRRELQAGKDALNGVGPLVGVFGSARTKPNHPDYEFARASCRALAEAGFVIVTGGGPGTMEAANRGAQEGGGISVGLTIKLPGEQVANRYLDIELAYHYFFVRKTAYVRNACAFVAFPGGVGTLDELFETLTLIETNKIARLPLVLARSSYWNPLLDWMRDTVVAEDKFPASKMKLMRTADSPEEIVRAVRRSSRLQFPKPPGSKETGLGGPDNAVR